MSAMGTFGSLFGGIGSLFSGAGNLVGGVASGAGGVASGAGAAASGAGAAASGAGNFVGDVGSSVGGGLSDLGDLITGKGGNKLTQAGPGDEAYDMLQRMKTNACRSCSESGWATYSLKNGLSGKCQEKGFTAANCAPLLR